MLTLAMVLWIGTGVWYDSKKLALAHQCCLPPPNNGI